jgi:hypothetical protein
MLAVIGEHCPAQHVTINQTRDMIVKFMHDHPETTHLAAERLSVARQCDASSPRLSVLM